jgi:hypothetical protein
VTIVDSSTLLDSQREFIGQTFEILRYCNRGGGHFYELYKGGWLFREDELKAAEEPEESIFTYKEALKLALDGNKMWPSNSCINPPFYIYFNNGEFMVHNVGEDTSFKEFDSSLLDSNCYQWKIYKKPKVAKPKFSKGQLFVSKEGIIGKVVSVPKESHMFYYVKYNLNLPNYSTEFESGMRELDEAD